MANPTKIIVIFVLASIIRGCVTLMFGYFNTDPDARYYFGLFNYLFFCFLMVSISIKATKIGIPSTPQIPGALQALVAIFYSIGIGLLFFAFFLGEFALEVILVSGFAPEFAYSFWRFREIAPLVHPLISVSVAAYIVCGVIVGPLLEELLFRVLLMRAFMSKRSLRRSAMLTSVVFMLAHFAQPYMVTTFLFSLALCYLYAFTRSLAMCALVHGTFNFVAYVHQNYFDIQWTRSIDQLASVAHWIPQMWMLIFSSVIMGLVVIRANRSRTRKTA